MLKTPSTISLLLSFQILKKAYLQMLKESCTIVFTYSLFQILKKLYSKILKKRRTIFLFATFLKY